MSAIFKILAIALALGAALTVAAGQAAAHSRLPAEAVVRGAKMVQPFGCTTFALEPFDPDCPTRHFHSGIDLAAPEGTAVYAATGGQAVSGYDPKGCGLFVLVTFDHHVRVLYCHLHSTAAFAAGGVAAGDLIGEVGSTGFSTGPHLHLEVQFDGRPVDPISWLESP